MIEAGYRCIEIRQGSESLPAPMKHLLEKVLTGKMGHEGHELLTWNADCVSARIYPALKRTMMGTYQNREILDEAKRQDEHYILAFWHSRS